MIKNSKQYKITKSQLAKFSTALNDLETKKVKGGTSALLTLQKAALKSQLLDLQREVKEYEDLTLGNIPITELYSIDELPFTLIKARISLNLSQKELGKMVSLPEQQIQRYEATEYESASISKIKEIADALNLKIEKHVGVPIANFSLKKFFKKMNSVGIDSDFIMHRLLPPRLAARFHDKDISPDLLCLQASYYIGKVFGIKPESIFKSKPLVLNTTRLAKVKYKISSNTNKKKLGIHTIYAHHIAQLVSKATKIKANKNIPDDPYIVREQILSNFGKITFDTILRYVWSWGIPVLVLDTISFHAACFIDKSRSIIILTQKTDTEISWMFNLLYEFYHISQGTSQITENITKSLNSQDAEERIASQFAHFVLLGKDSHKLTKKSLENSNWDISQIKKNLQKIPKNENVRIDVLANYVTSRLSEKEQNLHGISTVQKPLSNAR